MSNSLKEGTDTRVEIKNFTIVKEVLCKNYQSCNLIGPYHFLGTNPSNSTSFTRLFLAGRRAGAGHETMPGERDYVVCNHSCVRT